MDWVPHPDAEVEVNTDGDMVYSKMPKIIYVHFPGATWVIHPDLGEGVYPITPKSRTWELKKHTGISVRRTSYFVLPDFGATAHMCQGQTLDAAFVDPLESWVSVNVEDAVKSVCHAIPREATGQPRHHAAILALVISAGIATRARHIDEEAPRRHCA